MLHTSIVDILWPAASNEHLFLYVKGGGWDTLNIYKIKKN